MTNHSCKPPVTRRTFIRSSCAAIATTCLTKPLRAREMRLDKRYKMGLQLFTLNSIIGHDVRGTLKKVASIGYEDCETFGFDPEKQTYYGLPAKDFKNLLADNRLVTTSGHYDFAKYFSRDANAVKRFVDQCIAGARALNQRYITWPWLDPSSRSINDFKILADKLNGIGEQVKKGGLGFAYHNHDFEFTDHGGQYGYSIIMQETDPALVKLQLDLYWVMHSCPISAAELINKQPGRFVMWHIKDMDKVTRDYTELGNGTIDYTQILPLAKKAGLEYYYLEQGGNFAISPMISATKSAAFFRESLERYLP